MDIQKEQSRRILNYNYQKINQKIKILDQVLSSPKELTSLHRLMQYIQDNIMELSMML